MKAQALWVAVGVGALLFASACGGGGSTSGDSTTTTTTSDASTASDTTASDLAVASPTAAKSATSSSISVTKSLGKASSTPGDATTNTAVDKAKAYSDLAKGTGACAFTLTLPTPTKSDCYGPTLNYCNHPNATTSDADCVAPTTQTADKADDGQLPSGDLGLWSQSTSDGEACASAQMNYLVDSAAAHIDNMEKMVFAVDCAAEKEKTALPDVGKNVDLAAAVSKNVSITGLTFNTAKLERLSDTSDGNPVYKHTVSATMTFPGSSKSSTATITWTHAPKKGDKTTYRGHLIGTMARDEPADNNCGQGTSGSLHVAEIYYQKSGDTLTAEINKVALCGKDATAPTSLDPANKVSSSNKNGWGGNYNYMLYSGNVKTGIGTIQYAWQAGQGDGFTRVFNGTTATASTGDTGTFYFGFGPDIATAKNRATVQGFFCNWAGPGNQKGPQTTTPAQLLAQQQAVKRPSGSTKFATDSSNTFITFAPTNTCNASAGFKYFSPKNGQDQTFPSSETDTTSITTADNNKLAASTSVTNNLIATSSISFTAVTAPDKTGL